MISLALKSSAGHGANNDVMDVKPVSLLLLVVAFDHRIDLF